jgi:sodium-dependent dicarboxylate transporter 2/3/5
LNFVHILSLAIFYHLIIRIMDTKKTGLFLGPLAFVALLAFPAPAPISPEGWKVIALAVLMLTWWITESVPIAVTSLLPMLLLPMMGVQKLADAAAPYSNPVVYLFMGGFVIALAMERWNVHRRIALNIVRLTGTNADGILLGFYLSTAFISMWISNTATTIMMLPIALSVIDLLQRRIKPHLEAGMRHFSIAMMLGIAYASSIGGMATIIGTPPNVVFAGYMQESLGIEVSFAEWFIIGLPFAAILLVLAYIVLVKIMYPNRLGKFSGAQELVQEEIAELGPVSNGERRTMLVFIGAAFCWIFQSQINRFVPFLKLSDTAIALIAAISLFIIPSEWKKGRTLLEWGHTEKLPWGILLLFGGGLSLADGLATTGIIDLIGNQFKDLPAASWLVILGLATVSLFLTEVMSNVALVTIFLPVVGAIAVGMGIPAEEMCIPVTLAASGAFMLPMSTPPNAIVFASGHVRIAQMAKAGFVMNIISVLLITLFVKTLLPYLYEAGNM